ncbi:MAG: hypothetical protein HOD43_00770 [Candidatus Marinimicrobia bacterium]|jgi:hypothetical protein|nr:hypothetical protein [Candidatus Neomarinimicrobiota bacterium]MBT3630723.1 hypothetical protein [Candidatus Neomarinimicrobiota bacterium]MBT3825618.1 hypothetical protein [Candidatus Neomarinimicrobiota bacterium]MBT4132624.1 hypothetical protein [Candidatus Neomarinimicrobiota bacterium]MBT4294319.1 hypothetical protein [Candidatus Neomarinimicrobiota bacterium]
MLKPKIYRPLQALSIVILMQLAINCTSRIPEYLTSEAKEIRSSYFHSSENIDGLMLSGTINETPLFRFQGDEAGPTALIIGGTHGNEPAGFEAAHRLIKQFSDSPLKTGEIFIIPEANKIADQKNNRRIKAPRGVDIEMGNLNRCYPGNSHGLPMEKMAFEITTLIKTHDIDVVIDLHESPVFHLEYIEANSQYHGLGQTLIYTPNEEASWIALMLVDEMNEAIPPGLEQFSLAAGPVQHSAAWSAGEFFGIPGFTTETCKKLPLETRIDYQLKMVGIILREAGISP